MKEYFKLQYIMINRKISDSGIKPIIGYCLFLIAFIILSEYLFYKMEYAPYAYILIALLLTSKLSDIRRNDFLKICFDNKLFRKIRIMENLFYTLPFVTFLVYKEHFFLIFVLCIMTTLMALLNFKMTYNITIPTPFFKKPYEFTVGFRNTFVFLIFAYAFTVIAIIVDNFSLGIFSLLLIFVIVLTYYLKPENEYFVWSYSLTPTKFLIGKIKTAFFFSSYLSVPIFFALSLFFFENINALFLFLLLGYLYIAMIIFIKYSAFPNSINIGHAILLTMSLAIPPLLVIIIPFYANQSVKKLQDFLK